MKVGIYCGHGTSINGAWDSGTVYKYKGKTYTEAELMLPIAKSCVYYLRKAGVDVVTDVPKNRINMCKQIEKSNRENVRIHVAFHCDYAPAPAGTYPLYTSESGRKLAAKMNKRVLQYSSLKTRGLKKRLDLAELNGTEMPAVIFECGSIKRDLKKFLHEYDAIGFGAARGICDYLGVKFDPPQMRLLNALTTYEKGILKHKFKYNGKATNVSYNKALHGNKQVNCALFASWGLQKAKILPFTKRIWLGNGLNGSGSATILKKCKAWHPGKYWYHCTLHIGDVCGWQWGSSSANKVHTMVLRGFVNGHPKWATCGGSDIKARDLSRCRRTYERKKIKTICRIR